MHLVLENSPAFVALWLACSRLGAWMVPADPAAPILELSRQLRRIEAVVTVGSNERADDITLAAEQASDRIVAIPVDPSVWSATCTGPMPTSRTRQPG